MFVQAGLIEGLSEALKAVSRAFPVIFSAPSIAASGAKRTCKASDQGHARSASAAALGVRWERWVPCLSAGKTGHEQTRQRQGTALATILHLNSPGIGAVEAQVAGAQRRRGFCGVSALGSAAVPLLPFLSIRAFN